MLSIGKISHIQNFTLHKVAYPNHFTSHSLPQHLLYLTNLIIIYIRFIC